MKKCAILAIIFLTTITFSYAGGYTNKKIPSGQTVIVKEVHDNPIVTIDTWIKTGSIDENDNNSGVAHFLEHLFFKGTQKYPTGEFDKITESKGAIVNAATSKDYTHYYITIPSKYFELALDMHADMLLHPAIPEKELEKERKVVLEEIARSKDEPQSQLYDNFNTAFYTTHPYKRKIIGSDKVIETISRNDILNFYNEHYAPQNMTTIIVGDVDTKTAIEKVTKNFKAKNNKKIATTKFAKEPNIKQTREVVKTAEIKNSYMLMGFRTVDVKNQQESVVLDIIATILGDGKTSRLYKNIKDKKQLAFNISAGHSTLKDDGIFFVNANYQQNDYNTLKENIINELKTLKTTPVPIDELNKCKNMIERDMYYARESVSNISNELGYITTVFGDTDFYDKYIKLVKQVTQKQIMDAAKKYFNTEKMVISVLNPQSNSHQKKSAVQNKNIIKVNQKTSSITSTNGINKYILSNGSTLILNHNNSNDIIAIEIFAKGGAFLEKIAGTSNLMAAALLKGTKKYSSQELLNKLEENGIHIGLNATSDAFVISVKTTPKELPVVFDILNELVNNATFPTDELEKIKKEKILQFSKNRDNPMNIAFEEFKANIWENYPYSHTGLIYEKTFPKITQNNIKELYSTIFYPENIVISVNGNVSADVLKTNFENIFNSKSGKKVQLTDFKKQFEFLKSQKTIKKTKKSETAWLVIGWHTEGLNNLKDYATLEVIDGILGTGMSSRLFRNLREARGLAYQVGSSYGANANRGTFALYIGTNPKNITLAKNLMLQETEKLRKEPVSQDELQRTKDKITGNYIISLETNMEKASETGMAEALVGRWQFYKEYTDLINNVTPQDIIKTANKYFSKPYLYVQVSK